MKFLSFLCTKWMKNCEAMTSSTHSFAYSYGLVKKCFLKICETSKFQNFLIFQPIFIRFSLFCSENFTLSSEIKLDQLRTSPLTSMGTLMWFYYVDLYCWLWLQKIRISTGNNNKNCGRGFCNTLLQLTKFDLS